MFREFENINKNPFLTFIKPVLYAQVPLGSARMRICGKYIQPPHIWQKIYCILWLIQSTFGHIYVWVYFGNWSSSKGRTETQSTLRMVQISAEITLRCSVVFVNNFFYAKENMQLFTALRYVDVKLKIIEKVEHNNKINRFILLSIMMYVAFQGYHAIALGLELPRQHKWVVLFTDILIAEEFEMTLLMLLIIILQERLKYINKLIKEFSTAKWKKMRIDETAVYGRMSEAVSGIAKAFRNIEKAFSVFILTSVMHIFLCNLLNVELCILFVQNKNSIMPYRTFLRGFKFVTNIVLLGVVVDRFETVLQRTKEECFQVIKKNNNVRARRYAKNIIRIIKNELFPMSVFRTTSVSVIPFKLITLITQYSVVLLQFAYLN